MAATSMSFDFVVTHESVCKSVRDAVKLSHSRTEEDVAKAVKIIQDVFARFVVHESLSYDVRSVVDASFREELLCRVREICDVSTKLHQTDLYLLFDVVNLTLSIVSSSEVLPIAATLPLMLLADLMDTLTIDDCEHVFSVVESKVDVWTSHRLGVGAKNNLLLMCNDLLKRLSKSQNPQFCGRILTFLSNVFPLSDRSGVNLMSAFNVENVTLFEGSGDKAVTGLATIDDNGNGDVEMKLPDDETTIIEEADVKGVDRVFYRKFWTLQNYFRNPKIIYEPQQWKLFTGFIEDVLGVFSNHRIDSSNKKRPTSSTRVVDDAMESSSSPSSSSPSYYFTKYLTSPSLLNLQLDDVYFRRQVLLQMLIIFQYLTTSSTKFKASIAALSEEQSKWVSDATVRVFSLVEQASQDGVQFASSLKHALQHESLWIDWKNESCQGFERDPVEKLGSGQPPRKRMRHNSLKTGHEGAPLIDMGMPELTRLWQLSGGASEDAFLKLDSQKARMPSQDEFFEEVLEQLDPESGVEEQYFLTRDERFMWRGLRMLGRSDILKLFDVGSKPGTFSKKFEITLKLMVPESSTMVIEDDNNNEDVYIEEESST